VASARKPGHINIMRTGALLVALLPVLSAGFISPFSPHSLARPAPKFEKRRELLHAQAVAQNSGDSNQRPSRLRRIINGVFFWRKKSDEAPVSQTQRARRSVVDDEDEDDFLALGDDVLTSLREMKEGVGPVVAASDEPPKRKKLYDSKPKGKSSGRGGNVAGAVLDRPGDKAAQRKLDRASSKASGSVPPPRMSSTRAKAKQQPTGGTADDDIMDSVKPVKDEGADKLASDEDIARLNKMFGL